MTTALTLMMPVLPNTKLLSIIETLAANDEFKAILKAVRLDSWDKALDFITVRNFAFKSGENCYFLSQAGSAFLFRLVQEYEE